MVTIDEVAQHAGLSRTTVSRVINEHPYVSDAKRKQVLSAMEELGYMPNSAAQRLRNNKTKTIAVLLSRIVNPFFSQLVDAMELEAVESGYQLLLCNTRRQKEKEFQYLQLLKAKQVDGVILASIENDWQEIEPYTQYGPMLLCNEYVAEATIPMIKAKQREAAYEGVMHLIEKKHKRIAYCGGDERALLTLDRKNGFLEAMSDAGLPVYDEWIFSDTLGISDGKNIMKEISQMKTRPTAIFAGGDEVGAAMIKEAKSYGWNVPQDLAVIGFDDQPIAKIVEPSMTTIRQPIDELGRRAVQHMLAMIQESANLSEDIPVLLSELVVRDST